ncbi:hypothetical protein HDU96_001334 [Phlyctochytrium bullatum]|nr:hypothetical protein HDU96_001334 [Phlyctochytrium bullatum]
MGDDGDDDRFAGRMFWGMGGGGSFALSRLGRDHDEEDEPEPETEPAASAPAPEDDTRSKSLPRPKTTPLSSEIEPDGEARGSSLSSPSRQLERKLSSSSAPKLVPSLKSGSHRSSENVHRSVTFSTDVNLSADDSSAAESDLDIVFPESGRRRASHAAGTSLGVDDEVAVTGHSSKDSRGGEPARSSGGTIKQRHASEPDVVNSKGKGLDPEFDDTVRRESFLRRAAADGLLPSTTSIAVEVGQGSRRSLTSSVGDQVWEVEELEVEEEDDNIRRQRRELGPAKPTQLAPNTSGHFIPDQGSPLPQRGRAVGVLVNSSNSLPTPPATSEPSPTRTAVSQTATASLSEALPGSPMTIHGGALGSVHLSHTLQAQSVRSAAGSQHSLAISPTSPLVIHGGGVGSLQLSNTIGGGISPTMQQGGTIYGGGVGAVHLSNLMQAGNSANVAAQLAISPTSPLVIHGGGVGALQLSNAMGEGVLPSPQPAATSPLIFHGGGVGSIPLSNVLVAFPYQNAGGLAAPPDTSSRRASTVGDDALRDAYFASTNHIHGGEVGSMKLSGQLRNSTPDALNDAAAKRKSSLAAGGAGREVDIEGTMEGGRLPQPDPNVRSPLSAPANEINGSLVNAHKGIFGSSGGSSLALSLTMEKSKPGATLQDSMPVAELVDHIGKENGWLPDEVKADVDALMKNRLRTVGDLRKLSKTGWAEVQGLLPVSKDLMRAKVGWVDGATTATAPPSNWWHVPAGGAWVLPHAPRTVRERAKAAMMARVEAMTRGMKTSTVAFLEALGLPSLDVANAAWAAEDTQEGRAVKA